MTAIKMVGSGGDRTPPTLREASYSEAGWRYMDIPGQLCGRQLSGGIFPPKRAFSMPLKLTIYTDDAIV